MVDVHSPAIRSKNMRAIRGRETALEKRIAVLLDAAEFTYRIQDKTLAGRPDFVIATLNSIIFTHGCFWHHHHCHLFTLPATRTAFWLDKINRNVERDKRHCAALSDAGWKVLVVWECALRGKFKLDEQAIRSRLEEWLIASRSHAELDFQGIHGC